MARIKTLYCGFYFIQFFLFLFFFLNFLVYSFWFDGFELQMIRNEVYLMVLY